MSSAELWSIISLLCFVLAVMCFTRDTFEPLKNFRATFSPKRH